MAKNDLYMNDEQKWDKHIVSLKIYDIVRELQRACKALGTVGESWWL